MAKVLGTFWTDDSGSTAIEYALIAIIVGVSLIAALESISGSLNGYFQNVADAL